MFKRLLYKQISKGEEIDDHIFAKGLQTIGKEVGGKSEYSEGRWYCHICLTDKPIIYYTCKKCGKEMCSKHIRENKFNGEYICVKCLG